jgi:hypothetical protein
MHLSVLLAIVAVVLFFEHGQCPVLVRKVVWTILCPVRNCIAIFACPSPAEQDRKRDPQTC